MENILKHRVMIFSPLAGMLAAWKLHIHKAKPFPVQRKRCFWKVFVLRRRFKWMFSVLLFTQLSTGRSSLPRHRYALTHKSVSARKHPQTGPTWANVPDLFGLHPWWVRSLSIQRHCVSVLPKRHLCPLSSWRLVRPRQRGGTRLAQMVRPQAHTRVGDDGRGVSAPRHP